MTSITLPPDLAERLWAAARRLGKSPEECALSAIADFVADCEDAARLGRQLGGDGTARLSDDEFWD